MYLDANNLCGYAMSKFLRRNEFKRIDPKDFVLNNILVVVQKNMFSKLILNILKGYENHAMII